MVADDGDVVHHMLEEVKVKREGNWWAPVMKIDGKLEVEISDDGSGLDETIGAIVANPLLLAPLIGTAPTETKPYLVYALSGENVVSELSRLEAQGGKASGKRR